jgi:hypothetical protein
MISRTGRIATEAKLTGHTIRLRDGKKDPGTANHEDLSECNVELRLFC